MVEEQLPTYEPEEEQLPTYESEEEQPPTYGSVNDLGQGGLGKVTKYKHPKIGEYVTKKIFYSEESGGISAEIVREVSHLRALTHENIVRVYEMEHGGNQEYERALVYPFVGNDLRQYVEGRSVDGKLELTDFKSIMHQLLEGIGYCHRKNIMHRDLKPENLLMSKFGRLKIAGFGASCGFGLPIYNLSFVGTLEYGSPEMLHGSSNYGSGVDIWSVGCIMAELYVGYPLFGRREGRNAERAKLPFDSDNINDQIGRIFGIMGTPLSVEEFPNYAFSRKLKPQDLKETLHTEDTDGVDLLRKMLHLQPGLRISAQRALKHAWFRGLNSQQQEYCKIKGNQRFSERILWEFEQLESSQLQHICMKAMAKHLTSITGAKHQEHIYFNLIESTVRELEVSAKTLLATSMYLKRLKENLQSKLPYKNHHRLLLGCLSLASKYCDDKREFCENYKRYRQKWESRSISITLSQSIHVVEEEVLRLLDWSAMVSKLDLGDTYEHFKRPALLNAQRIMAVKGKNPRKSVNA